MNIYRIGDVTVLNDHAEVPGLGFLPVNAFVLRAEQPVVIDTGLSTADKDFVSALAEVLDPADVRWVWITHPDRDHTGGLWPLLEAAPAARLVTTFLGLGIMSLEWRVPLSRVFLLNPGQALDVGDRQLHCFRPPLFDSPSTTGFLDDRTGVLFSSDCFGAQCRRRSWRHRMTYARWVTRFATFSCCGHRSIVRGCIRSTRQGFVPRLTRSVPWAPPRFSAPTCRLCSSRMTGSSKPCCSRRRQSRLSAPTRWHSRPCSPLSRLPSL
jgi:hypothetical protein